MIKSTAVLCTILFALTACGSGNEDAAREDLKATLLDNESELGAAELSEKQAECLSNDLVDDIGVDQLQEYGLLDEDGKVIEKANPDDLSAEDADAMAEVFVGCVDFEEMFAQQMGDMSDQMTEEQTKCITEAIDKDAFKDVLSAGFQGEEPEFGGDMQTKMMECVTPAG